MNFNKAIIIGNLTQNPEVRKTPAGSSVANFGVATNRVWTNQQGAKQEQVEFHNIVAFGRLADIVGQYLAKGRLCMVEGRIQTRNWVDNAGVKHWKTEIIAENIQLGPKTAPSAGGYSQNNNSGYNGNQGSSDSQAYETEPIVSSSDNEEEIKIEDIPF
ncbi:MAG: single-stranded DNA-binding protein [Candidatus Buchananbacteria bacterium]|jgi:single-strand DNA-binding protein